MRTSLLTAVALLLLAHGGPVAAQSYPLELTLATDTEVRSGPTPKLYATSRLRAGERVFVVREVKDQPGWLAIKPPPGSFSWIKEKYVRQAGDLGFVDADVSSPVPILPGSAVVNQEPNVESMKLVAGTIVTIVARPQQGNGENWLPILPHPSEVRYIQADAVRPPATQVASTSPPNWTLNGSAAPADPLLAQADEALRNGDRARAVQYLQQAVDRATDPRTRTFAQNRLASLMPTNGNPATGPTNPNLLRPVNNSTVTTSMSPGTTPATAINTGAANWSTYGVLRSTDLQVDGQPIYRLENGSAAPVYVATPAGKSLRDYVGRTISVYGPVVYRGDTALRMQYVVATHVAVP